MGKDSTQRYKLERQRRRSRIASRDRRVQIRKGVGACIFTLGIPIAIGASIILIVANTNSQHNSVPPSFPVLGPLLLVLSASLFAVGSLMTGMLSLSPCISFCLPDDPKSFCWTRCPGLLSLLNPGKVVLMKQMEAGLHALQTVPSKPALKTSTEASKQKSVKRGVRFSDGDPEAGLARESTSSEHSENGRESSANTSLLSLRHCKIYPKDSDTWDSVTKEDNSGVFTLSGCGDGFEPAVLTDTITSAHVTTIDEDSAGDPRTRNESVIVLQCEHL